MPLYETRFAKASYAYRPERGTEDAVLRCRRHLDEGRVWIVDMDIEKFFDTVCQARLLEILFRDIPDRRVPLLICKYISAGAVRDGKFQKVTARVPQGGPLSPLLANIMTRRAGSGAQPAQRALCPLRRRPAYPLPQPRRRVSGPEAHRPLH